MRINRAALASSNTSAKKGAGTKSRPLSCSPYFSLLGLDLDDFLGLGNLDVDDGLALGDLLVGGVVGLDYHLRAVGDLALEDHLAHGIFDHPLQDPLERPGAERRVVARVGELVEGLVCELHGDLALGHLLAEALDLDLDDQAHVLALELVEDDDLVDPVEQLGAEDLAQLARDPALHLLVGETFLAPAEAKRLGLVDGLGPDVGGHDEHHVLEVHGATLRVGELPVLEYLEEYVEDIRVGFLDLVEEDDRVRTAPDLLSELAALVVADVARGRADQTGDGVALHVLGHVQTDHGVLVAEEVLGERPRELGLADARGAEEDKRAAGTVRVLDAGEGPPYGAGDGLYGLLLPNDAPVQRFLHLQEARGLLLGHLLDRDASPHGDDLGDLVLTDGDARLGVALAPGLLELPALHGELLLVVPQARGPLELLAVYGGLLLGADLRDLLVQLLVVG